MSASSPSAAGFAPGLEGVAVAQTRLSSVDGQAGELTIRGFPVQELAGRASYEEAAYLLWFDALPAAAQLARFSASLARLRALPAAALDALGAIAAERAPVMDALRMAAGMLGLRAGDEDDFGRPWAPIATAWPSWPASRPPPRRTGGCSTDAGLSRPIRPWATRPTTCTCSAAASPAQPARKRSRLTWWR